MSDCGYQGRVQALYDGELAGDERRDLEAHVLQCAGCARELEELRGLSRLFAAAAAPAMPPEALERLRRRTGAVVERALLPMSEFMAGAAAAVLLCCSIWLWRADGAAEPWEWAAVTPPADVAAAGGPETRVAQWIVTDLTGGNAGD